MQTFLRRITPASLALVLAFVTGCDNQITPPTPARLEPSDAISAAKFAVKSVVALEPLPGTPLGSSNAAAINDLGQAVGQSFGLNVPAHAVIWDNSNIPQDLGTLPGHVHSGAVAISNNGSVIAGISTDGTRPVRWLKSNGQWLIDPLPAEVQCIVTAMSSDGTAIAGNCGPAAVVWINGSRIPLGTASARGVNSRGQVVGTDANLAHAFLWTVAAGSAPVVTDLGNLGGTAAAAIAINDAGEITGWSTNANGDAHAFLWTPKKRVMTDLGPVSGVGIANGINATGLVAGFSAAEGTSNLRATLFDHGKVFDLGLLPGYRDSGATGVNNAGQVVGTSSDGFGQRATKWIVK